MSNTLNVEIDVNLTMQHCDDNIYLTNGDKLVIHHYTDSYEEHRWYILRDIIVNYKDKLWRMPWFETLKSEYMSYEDVFGSKYDETLVEVKPVQVLVTTYENV